MQSARQPRQNARQRILEAAEDLAREHGPGNLSLDAVAARAGVSKGGLLYHFPSKAKLLEALVEGFLSAQDAPLAAEAEAGAPNGVLRAYLDLCCRGFDCQPKPPSGLLAALAEDPSFLAPVRHYERIFLDRIRANATDPALATLLFVALHGIRNMQLLNISVLRDEEIAEATGKMRGLLETATGPAAPLG